MPAFAMGGITVQMCSRGSRMTSSFDEFESSEVLHHLSCSMTNSGLHPSAYADVIARTSARRRVSPKCTVTTSPGCALDGSTVRRVSRLFGRQSVDVDFSPEAQAVAPIKATPTHAKVAIRIG